ncbi:MAG: hypothetical protein M0Q44_02885 [Methylobacter sp.]|jgi:hypothetical protein|nr:hypothetical protein [Methylobacter sp.]
MKAKKIMIVRHAEKPAESGAPFGVDINGNRVAFSLVTFFSTCMALARSGQDYAGASLYPGQLHVACRQATAAVPHP